MSYLIGDEIEIDKEMIEYILGRDISDELFEKYVEEIHNHSDGNVLVYEYIVEEIKHYSSDVLNELESELN